MSLAFTKPMAPGETDTAFFTAAGLLTSFGGVADLPVNAALQKVLAQVAVVHSANDFQESGSFRGSRPAITGATALPVSQRPLSERKSFFRSPRQAIDRIRAVDDDHNRVGGGLATRTDGIASQMAAEKVRFALFFGWRSGLPLR